MREKLVPTRRGFVTGTALAGTAALLAAVPQSAKAWTSPDGSVVTNSLLVHGPSLGKGAGLGHHVEAYGAIGNASSFDCTAAFLRAIVAAQAGVDGSNTVVLGAKTYHCASSIVVTLSNAAIAFAGEGSMGTNRSAILFATGAGLVFKSSGVSFPGTIAPISLRDMCIQSSGGTATGLQIGDAALFLDNFAKHILENVYIEGFYRGLHLVNCRQVSCQQVVCRNAESEVGGLGLLIEQVGEHFCGEHSFINCEFVTKAGVSPVCVHIKSNATLSPPPAAATGIAGIQFIGCDFYYGTHIGVSIENVGDGIVQDIFMSQCQFDYGSSPTTSTALSVANLDDGYISDIRIIQCHCLNQHTGVNMYANAASRIKNVDISSCYFFANRTVAITFNSVANFTIANNQLYDAGAGPNSGAVAMWFAGPGTTGFVIQGNVHLANQTTTYLANLVGVGAGGYGFVIANNSSHQTSGAICADSSGSVPKLIANNLPYL